MMILYQFKIPDTISDQDADLIMHEIGRQCDKHYIEVIPGGRRKIYSKKPFTDLCQHAMDLIIGEKK